MPGANPDVRPTLTFAALAGSSRAVDALN